MTGDPYAPRSWREPVSEVRGELGQFVQRLRELGATADEIRSVEEHWDDFDDPDEWEDDPDAWTPERRALFVQASDRDLERIIRAGRAEYEYATTTEEDAAEEEALRRIREAQAAAYERMGATVEVIVKWVDGDKLRAEAVLGYETGADGAGRKTLVAAMEQVLTSGGE